MGTPANTPRRQAGRQTDRQDRQDRQDSHAAQAKARANNKPLQQAVPKDETAASHNQHPHSTHEARSTATHLQPRTVGRDTAVHAGVQSYVIIIARGQSHHHSDSCCVCVRTYLCRTPNARTHAHMHAHHVAARHTLPRAAPRTMAAAFDKAKNILQPARLYQFLHNSTCLLYTSPSPRDRG